MRVEAYLGGFAIQVGERFILDLDYTASTGGCREGAAGGNGSVSIAVTTRGQKVDPCPCLRSTTPRKSAAKPLAKANASTSKPIARPSGRGRRSARKRREAMKEGQKETSAGNVKTPALSVSLRQDGGRVMHVIIRTGAARYAGQ
jgi:hypothetical protein